MASEHRQNRRAKIDWLVANRSEWESLDLNEPASFGGLVANVAIQMRLAGLYSNTYPPARIAWGLQKMMRKIVLP